MHKKLLKVTWNNSDSIKRISERKSSFFREIYKTVTTVCIEEWKLACLEQKSNILLEVCNKTTCIYLSNKYNVNLEVSLLPLFMGKNSVFMYEVTE